MLKIELFWYKQQVWIVEKINFGCKSLYFYVAILVKPYSAKIGLCRQLKYLH